jgi:hypothetical protein
MSLSIYRWGSWSSSTTVIDTSSRYSSIPLFNYLSTDINTNTNVINSLSRGGSPDYAVNNSINNSSSYKDIDIEKGIDTNISTAFNDVKTTAINATNNVNNDTSTNTSGESIKFASHNHPPTSTSGADNGTNLRLPGDIPSFIGISYTWITNSLTICTSLSSSLSSSRYLNRHFALYHYFLFI